MPGYGYAAVSKEKSASWGALIRDYLRGRPNLIRVFVLIDGRHGIKESDEATMKLLDASAVSYAIALTKRDEVKKADQEARIATTLQALAKRPAAYPEVFFTSARTGEGIAELRAHARSCWRREARFVARRAEPGFVRARRPREGPASLGLHGRIIFRKFTMSEDKRQVRPLLKQTVAPVTELLNQDIDLHR